MQSLDAWIDQLVDQNLRRVMAGDAALPRAAAVDIARGAAEMAAKAARAASCERQRLDIAAIILGGLASSSVGEQPTVIALRALTLADALMATAAATSAEI